MTNRARIAAIAALYAGLLVVATAWQQQQNRLAEPFRGVTTDGTIRPNLFAIRSTGVSTAPMRNAAAQFLGALNDDQRAKTAFPVDDLEWRDWNNVHRYVRKGVSFAELADVQRERAYGLLRASLSAKGSRHPATSCA